MDSRLRVDLIVGHLFAKELRRLAERTDGGPVTPDLLKIWMTGLWDLRITNDLR